MLFFYFSAYLTGIGTLLERLDAFCSSPAAEVALKVVCSILLVFYALVLVAGCVYFGIDLTKSKNSRTTGIERGCPKDQTEEQYTKWLEEQSKGDNGPLFTIIAPFEKKYAWCV